VDLGEDVEDEGAGLVLVGEVESKGVAQDDALGEGQSQTAGLVGVGLGAGKVLGVDGCGEGIDLGGRDGGHQAGEEGFEGRVVLDGGVGEKEAFV